MARFNRQAFLASRGEAPRTSVRSPEGDSTAVKARLAKNTSDALYATLEGQEARVKLPVVFIDGHRVAQSDKLSGKALKDYFRLQGLRAQRGEETDSTPVSATETAQVGAAS